jgi:hypothetical protein
MMYRTSPGYQPQDRHQLAERVGRVMIHNSTHWWFLTLSPPRRLPPYALMERCWNLLGRLGVLPGLWIIVARPNDIDPRRSHLHGIVEASMTKNELIQEAKAKDIAGAGPYSVKVLPGYRKAAYYVIQNLDHDGALIDPSHKMAEEISDVDRNSPPG